MRVLCLTVLILLVTGAVRAEVDVVRHISPASAEDERNRYFLALLELALDKTRSEFGDYRLQPVPDQLSQSRAVALLAQGRTLDVVWTMTSDERERRLRPVRIPLLKGLMGLRLLVIRAGDQSLFDNIRSLDQLRKLRAGQGSNWPDARILRANDLPLTTTTSYEGLFRMLADGRFDYLPRAVNEPWEEVEAFEELDLAVEEKIALYYPAPAYFFVAPNDERLARRLKSGLEKAVADGSFGELFRGHPVNRHAFDQAGLLERRVLRLNNPFLPDATPLERKQLWWMPPSRREDADANRN